MDSPLNLAHRCHRKADYYLNDHRFKEAIDCHLRAAEYISEALMNTSCEKMRASLETQKEFHLSQEKLLKQRELCEAQKKHDYKQQIINKQLLREKFGVYNNLGNNSNNNNSNINCNESDSQTHKTDKKCLELELLSLMEENDSLLQFLIDKNSDQKKSDSISELTNQRESTPHSGTSCESVYKSGTKKPKDDKTTIEELQTVNEKLRQLVFQLLEELEKSQKDNFHLQIENQKLKEENKNAYSSALPELPPLEPPALLY